MNVLIACECSQKVCKAFRKLGARAFSCDLQPCYGGHPEWHIIGDVRRFVEGGGIKTENGDRHKTDWDLIIAHPPCTYLCCTQMKYYSSRYGEKALERHEKQKEAIQFFEFFTKIEKPCCIENPVGIMSTIYRKPDQIIEPWMFGDAACKRTCLWLNKLPNLKPTNVVEPCESRRFASGKSMNNWYFKTSLLPKSERSRVRSETFDGIAQAMAEQWVKCDLKPVQLKLPIFF